jgi:adenylate cyclase
MSITPPSTINSSNKGKWRQRRWRRFIHALILLGAGILFTAILVLVQPFHTVDQWTKDQFLGSGTISPNIVVVGIDDKSFETYGRWSEWSRDLHAKAIDNLADAGASVIGFDIVFANSTTADDILAMSLQKADSVVLGVAGTNQVLGGEAGLTFDEFLIPATPLFNACNNVGHVNVMPDFDGKVRQIPLVVKQTGGKVYPAFSVAVLQALFRMTDSNNYQIDNNRLNLLARDIPVDSSYLMRVNYPDRIRDIPCISYSDIISGDFDPSTVKNKIVLIGITATGEIDTWAIPNVATRVPGVLIHAATMDTILRQQFLAETGTGVTFLTGMLLTVICAILLPLCGTWRWTDILKGTGIVLLLLIIYLVASSLIAGGGRLIDVFYPSLILLALYVTNTIFIAIREQSDKKFVKGLFGRYVSPQIAQEIVTMANDGALALGGEERDVTIFFADIRNFTTISEKMSPEGVVKMLNTYLPVMIDAIIDNKGIVNKFAGDSIMAVWNAPQSQPDHAVLAVKAAWEAQSKLAGLTNTLSPLPVKFGIGINTGIALAGNLGSTGRSEYSVIGDTVNLASRICSSTPGGEIWIGHETYCQVTNSCKVDTLEPQSFKGKTSPVPVYRVTGWQEATLEKPA